MADWLVDVSHVNLFWARPNCAVKRFSTRGFRLISSNNKFITFCKYERTQLMSCLVYNKFPFYFLSISSFCGLVNYERSVQITMLCSCFCESCSR